MVQNVGNEILRKDAWNKVTGSAKYNDDVYSSLMLHARLLTSTEAHSVIETIDVSEALKVPGVHAIVTGENEKILMGSLIRDMPILADKRTRYYGEPIAVAIADEEWQAAQAAQKIIVKYKPLPIINSASEAIFVGAPLIHEDLTNYETIIEEIRPEKGTNIVNRVKIRKGDMQKGWSESTVVIEANYSLPQANHVYMETRNAHVEILSDGTLNIYTASQGPHAIRKLIAHYLKVSEGQVIVHTSLVGGSFGGKVNPHPELIAYLASKAVGGRMVSLSLTREENFATACKIGADMKIKLGSDFAGKLKAFEVTYLIDSGAYADTGPRMARAAAASCSGLYNIENVQCDSLCVYTNHVYVTSFRGFGHEVSTFCIERTMEKLANKLGMDPLLLRKINLIKEGDTSPTQEKITLSNAGNPQACIDKLQEIMKWNEGYYADIGNNKIRAKGISLFLKTSSSPTDASAGAVIMFCPDGSVNLNCSVVECGPGMHTVIPQILAEALKMDVNKIYINTEVNTRVSPELWKTVASMSTFMLGKAVLAAADDVIKQMKKIASTSMRCDESDVGLGEERIYLKSDPSEYLSFKDLAFGVEYSNGNSVGGQVIGRGSYVMTHLTKLDAETGKGKPGPYWTPGAQGLEIEYDKKAHSFRLLRAITVIDAGRVINPATAKGQISGSMNMGLGLATREQNRYDQNGKLENTSLRTYKVIHYGEVPEYIVHFIETPNPQGPYGLRGIGEHGVLGMGSSLANALSQAAGVEFDSLPITFETLWNLSKEYKSDTL